jgi:alanine racemase
MLYGASPFSAEDASQFDLKPTMQLESRVIAVQSIPKGESIGYGATWQSPRPSSQIAIVAIGYGDGYPRQAKTGTPVLVNGRHASVVGRVSMDMLGIDVSDAGPVKIGDPVILWGEGLPVELVARAIGTLPNELYCRCTNGRFPIVHR